MKVVHDAWIKYQNQFGSSDAFVTMNDHIRGMSNDISLMEILGPDPDETFQTLIDTAKKKGVNTMGVEGAYNVVSGKVDQNMAVSDLGNAAQAASGTLRNIHTASKLGSATLSAISDLGVLAVVVEKIGIRANVIPMPAGDNSGVLGPIDLQFGFKPPNRADLKFPDAGLDGFDAGLHDFIMQVAAVLDMLDFLGAFDRLDQIAEELEQSRHALLQYAVRDFMRRYDKGEKPTTRKETKIILDAG